MRNVLGENRTCTLKDHWLFYTIVVYSFNNLYEFKSNYTIFQTQWWWRLHWSRQKPSWEKSSRRIARIVSRSKVPPIVSRLFTSTITSCIWMISGCVKIILCIGYVHSYLETLWWCWWVLHIKHCINTFVLRLQDSLIQFEHQTNEVPCTFLNIDWFLMSMELFYMSVIKQSCRYVCLFSSEFIWPTVENRLFRDGDNTQLAASISLFIKAPFIPILISFPLFYILYICASSMISVSSFLYLMKSVFPAQKTK